MPSSWRLAGGPGGCWCWPRCWTVTAIPGTVLTAPATCQYLAGEDAARPPDPQQAWSAVLALERAGLVAVDAASAPPAVWVSPALQAAVRAVSAAGAAGPGGPRGGRCAGAGVAPAPAPVMAGRRAAVVRGEPAAGRRGRAVGRRLLPPAAAGSRAEPGRRRTGRPGGGLVAGAGRRTASGSSARPTRTPWRPAACWPPRCWPPGRQTEAVTWFGGCTGQPRQHARARSPRHHRGPGQPGPRAGRPPGSPARRSPSWRRRPPAASGSAGRAMPARVAAREEYAAALPGRGQDRRGDPLLQAAAGRPRAAAPARTSRHPGRPAAAGRRLAWPRARPRTPSPSTRRSWPAGSSALGPDHPDTLAARAGLAAAYDAAGQMGAALQLHQEACAGYERVFGADHPDTLARRADLARAYSAAGQPARP